MLKIQQNSKIRVNTTLIQTANYSCKSGVNQELKSPNQFEMNQVYMNPLTTKVKYNQLAV